MKQATEVYETAFLLGSRKRREAKGKKTGCGSGGENDAFIINRCVNTLRLYLFTCNLRIVKPTFDFPMPKKVFNVYKFIPFFADFVTFPRPMAVIMYRSE